MKVAAFVHEFELIDRQVRLRKFENSTQLFAALAPLVFMNLINLNKLLLKFSSPIFMFNLLETVKNNTKKKSSK